jgi:hypothetical protein
LLLIAKEYWTALLHRRALQNITNNITNNKILTEMAITSWHSLFVQEEIQMSLFTRTSGVVSFIHHAMLMMIQLEQAPQSANLVLESISLV